MASDELEKSARVEPGTARHLNIQETAGLVLDVNTVCSFIAGSALAYNNDILVPLQPRANSKTRERFIIHDQHSYSHAGTPS
jgi:hypothetical protein